MEGRPPLLLAAYLIRSTGSFLASWLNPELDTPDEDLLAAQLPVVLGYVQRSPATRGRSHEAVLAGDLTILVERGRHSELVAVVRGEPARSARDALREAVRTWERRRLRLWRATDMADEAAAAMEEILPRDGTLAVPPPSEV